MKNVFIVVLKTTQYNRVYEVISNYFFKSKEKAENYAQDFIKTSSTFTEFEIKELFQEN